MMATPGGAPRGLWRSPPSLTLALAALLLTVVAPCSGNVAPEDQDSTYFDNVGFHGQVITISESGPRAFMYKNFLSPEECDYLIDKALPHLKQSDVIDNDTGDSYLSNVRTSSSMFFQTGEDEVISRIEKRIAAITHIPVSHGEGIQILQYINGQKYDSHYDYFHDEVNSARAKGGQRIATLLMYLKTVPINGGGETIFPDAKHGHVHGEEWSSCAQGKLAVKPARGDALLFYSLFQDATKDPSSLHGSCPTTEGEKYSATKWMHVYPIGGGCYNAHEHCEFWAGLEECEKNPVYMNEHCRPACGLCEMLTDLAACNREPIYAVN